LSSNIYSIFYKNGSKTNLDYTQGLIKWWFQNCYSNYTFL
jgi:hypothetical protein